MSDFRRYPERIRKKKDLNILDQSCETSVNPRKWSQAEKECLLDNLLKYGDQDVFLLASKLGSKSPLAVHTYLAKQKEIAEREQPPNLQNRSSRFKHLEKWLRSMRERRQKTPLPAPAALSMLMIALLEDHPVSTDDEVNFPEAYNYLFELLSGRHAARLSHPLSAPTRKFIRLTMLSLMKEVSSNIGEIVDKFVQVPRMDPESADVPRSLKYLLTTPHNNPLDLNMDAVLMADLAPIIKQEIE